MTERWRLEVGRVVVHGAPPGALDHRELRALVGIAIAERVRSAELPRSRRATAVVRIDAGRMTAGAPSVADAVASAVVGAVTGGRGHGRG